MMRYLVIKTLLYKYGSYKRVKLMFRKVLAISVKASQIIFAQIKASSIVITVLQLRFLKDLYVVTKTALIIYLKI